MARIDDVESQLRKNPRIWLVTGGAGFIGSHLVERLQHLQQQVRVLDSCVTGNVGNLAAFGDSVHFIKADMNELPDSELAQLFLGVDVVLHQAALGSVPRSLTDPLASHRANVDGFIRMLWAAHQAGVKRFVYASSSSVYGSEPALPKVEARIGDQLSPYAATKRINEIYAHTFQHAYGLQCIGLRYFNVFGARQDPNGPYAAVIPRWVHALLSGSACVINGDGDTTLTELQRLICAGLQTRAIMAGPSQPVFAPFRAGDVRHSHADIGLAQLHLGYAPTHDLQRGLDAALPWYVRTHAHVASSEAC
jgi:UDP-N-acetylglucosamine/UDP-N-acetylgalactosamine 4-epimerase